MHTVFYCEKRGLTTVTCCSLVPSLLTTTYDKDILICIIQGETETPRQRLSDLSRSSPIRCRSQTQIHSLSPVPGRGSKHEGAGSPAGTAKGKPGGRQPAMPDLVVMDFAWAPILPPRQSPSPGLVPQWESLGSWYSCPPCFLPAGI